MDRLQEKQDKNDKYNIQQLLESGDHMSVCSMMTQCTLGVDEDISDQFQLLQLAEKLEATALELRLYCERKEQNIKQQSGWLQKKRIPLFITENIFTITLIWQLLCVALLEIIDTIGRHFEKENRQIYVAGLVVMIIFQFSNLMLAIAVTVKLTKQYMHKTASMKFLLQSYASTLVLFGGLYTFIAKCLPKAFIGLRGNKKSRTYSLEIFSQLMFTSISTGTLCGSSSVTALHVVTEIIMSFQMLLSFIYFASILSQVISPTTKKSTKERYKELVLKNKRIVSSTDKDDEAVQSARQFRSYETI